LEIRNEDNQIKEVLKFCWKKWWSNQTNKKT